MTERCVGEPLSWLLLEQYQLGELEEKDRARAAAHLTVCRACAACIAHIEADDARVLPPLDVGQSARRARRFLASGAAALSIAAVAVLAMGRAWREGNERIAIGRAGTERVKGNAMAFALVRDDGAHIDDMDGVFRDSDRFKAVVACPPQMSATFDLVVFDASGASFPLQPARRLPCGNALSLPGAFSLKGSSQQTVCVVWSEDRDPDRELLARGGEVALDHRALCKRLSPVDSKE